MKTPAPSFWGLKPANDAASRMGHANVRRDTRPELSLRKALWGLGLRYRIDDPRLPGRPDIVFRGAKVVVFCDGDFWHGRDWSRKRARLAKGANPRYWIAKIDRNRRRDRRVARELA